MSKNQIKIFVSIYHKNYNNIELGVIVVVVDNRKD
jgi:hypothetical protein